jgi:hypothetical protein
LVHAKAKQGSGISANANNRLSLVHWLEPFLDRIQKKNNNTKTNIACLKELSIYADGRTKVCNLT